MLFENQTCSLNIWRNPTSKWIYILGLITGGYMSVILELPNISHYTIFRSATEKTTHPTLLTHSTQAKRLLTQKCGVFMKATRSSSACLMVNLSVINQPADFSVQMDGIHQGLGKSGHPGSLILLKLEKHIVYLSLSVFKLKSLDVPYLMKMIPRCTLLHFRGKNLLT